MNTYIVILFVIIYVFFILGKIFNLIISLFNLIICGFNDAIIIHYSYTILSPNPLNHIFHSKIAAIFHIIHSNIIQCLISKVITAIQQIIEIVDTE